MAAYFIRSFLKNNKELQIIKRALYFLNSMGGNVGINFGGFAAAVAQQTLYIPQIGALLQQMGSKTVAQRVRGEFTGNAGFLLAGIKYAAMLSAV